MITIDLFWLARLGLYAGIVIIVLVIGKFLVRCMTKQKPCGFCGSGWTWIREFVHETDARGNSWKKYNPGFLDRFKHISTGFFDEITCLRCKKVNDLEVEARHLQVGTYKDGQNVSLLYRTASQAVEDAKKWHKRHKGAIFQKLDNQLKLSAGTDSFIIFSPKVENLEVFAMYMLVRRGLNGLGLDEF